MRMEYTNPPLGTATLLANLQNEGLAIMNERKAFAFLENVSYFRFAAYLHPFKASDKHDYKENATFEKAVRLYEFDAKLRTLLFSAIQKIEISLRAKVINQFSLTYGAFWFINPDLAIDKHKFAENLSSRKQRKKIAFISLLNRFLAVRSGINDILTFQFHTHRVFRAYLICLQP